MDSSHCAANLVWPSSCTIFFMRLWFSVNEVDSDPLQLQLQESHRAFASDLAMQLVRQQHVDDDQWF